MFTPFHPKQASPTLQSSLSWDVTQRKFVVTEVLVQPISTIFKGQAVQEEF